LPVRRVHNNHILVLDSDYNWRRNTKMDRKKVVFRAQRNSNW
jgi:hypothetical protein